LTPAEQVGWQFVTNCVCFDLRLAYPKLRCGLFRFKYIKFTMFTPFAFRSIRKRGFLWGSAADSLARDGAFGVAHKLRPSRFTEASISLLISPNTSGSLLTTWLMLTGGMEVPRVRFSVVINWIAITA
jgi:hypothetical protein